MNKIFTFMTRSWGVARGLIRIDREHARAVDLSRPVILVPLKGAYMMIDGWHRAWKAHEEGVKELPAHVLTGKEEKRVRIR